MGAERADGQPELTALTVTPSRRPRADSVRNRRNILAAAREQITLNGPDVGMDQIAASAGVAVGTLYRHFDTKTDLVGAVIAEYVDDVAQDAEESRDRVVGGATPGDALRAFLCRVLEALATNYAVKAVADALGTDGGTQKAEARASAALGELIEAGQASGEIHPDVSVDDIYLLISTAPTDQPPAARARWLALVLPGLDASRT
jgi:AcrR family transcriptional regulator